MLYTFHIFAIDPVINAIEILVITTVLCIAAKKLSPESGITKKYIASIAHEFGPQFSLACPTPKSRYWPIWGPM